MSESEIINVERFSGSCCSVKELSGGACKDGPIYTMDDGKGYCILHCPRNDKYIKEFNEALKKRLADGDFNFCGVRFPYTSIFDQWCPVKKLAFCAG